MKTHFAVYELPFRPHVTGVKTKAEFEPCTTINTRNTTDTKSGETRTNDGQH